MKVSEGFLLHQWEGNSSRLSALEGQPALWPLRPRLPSCPAAQALLRAGLLPWWPPRGVLHLDLWHKMAWLQLRHHLMPTAPTCPPDLHPWPQLGLQAGHPSELLELPQLLMGKLRLEGQVQAATGCAWGRPPSSGHTHVHSHRPLGVPQAHRDPVLVMALVSSLAQGQGCLMHFWGSEV